MGGGDPEHGQDRVAHELLEEPAVSFDLLAQAIEGPVDDGLDHLGVLSLRHGRRPNQVGEQRRGELPLPPGRRRGLGQGGRAGQAEAGALGIVLSAVRTDRHVVRSLG